MKCHSICLACHSIYFHRKRKLKNLQALKNKSVDQGENTLIRDESVHLLSDSRIGEYVCVSAHVGHNITIMANRFLHECSNLL